jgi:capsular exopolysaccharide synthesis family protein
VLLTIAVVTAGAVYASLRQEKLYQASADVFLDTQNLAAGLANVQLPDADPVRQGLTQAAFARSPAIARQALELAHVKGTATRLLSHSSVTSAANADILTFSVTDPEPPLAERLADSYASAYTRYRRRVETDILTKALKQVRARMARMTAHGQQSSVAYVSLADREQQMSNLEALLGSNALLIRPAERAEKTQPKTLRNALLAGGLGLLIGIGLAFLRDALDTRVRSTNEVQERLDLPLLARIPELPRRLRSNDLLMVDKPHHEAAEAYRILATNLDLVNLERRAQTVMFTSAQRAEGKSTTIANLAVALARGGRHIVVLDLDLRSPSLADHFYLEREPGLTHVALGRSTLDEALRTVAFSNEYGLMSRNGTPAGLLEVLPVGGQPPNPAELAGSHALVEILAEVERRADLVLIDAPPILHFSDAMTLTSRVDALVVVTRLQLMRRPMLLELRRVLATAPTTKLGFVVTGASAAQKYGDGYAMQDVSRWGAVA